MSDFIFKNVRGLHIVHFNVRSLLSKGKFDMFKTQVAMSGAHLVCLSETWLNPKLPSSIIEIPGYNLIRLDRAWGGKCRGGGVAIYAQDQLVLSEDLSKCNKSSKDIEVQWIKICNQNQHDIVIGNIYRPPQGNAETFSDYIFDTINGASLHPNTDIFILGDMNFDFLDKKNKEVRDITHMARSLGLRSLIKSPTRLSTTNSCLDQIFTNCDVVANAGTLNCSVSDHIGIFVSRKKGPAKSDRVRFEGRSYRNYVKEDFQGQLIDANWEVFYNEQDPETCWRIMAGIILKYIDIMCPLKTFNVKANMDPWITNELLEEIRDKDLLLKRARRTKLHADWGAAKNARNRVGRQIELARANYFKEEHDASRGDPKRFWRNISSVLPGNKSHMVIDSLVDQDSNESVSQQDAAEFINKFFANIGPNLARDNNTAWEYGGLVNDERLTEVRTDYEVLNLCKGINITKSSGIDHMSSKFLKDALVVLVPQLVYMFNQSLSLGVFPSSWKIAKVVPSFKGGNKSDVGNFRPISLLPLPGKLLEKIVHTKISLFLDSTDMLSDKQNGFRKGHSTTQSIADLTDDLFNSMNKGKITLAAFIDLKKAFDTVNHVILVKKLECMGIKGDLLRWTESYLSNRCQKTIANGVSSSAATITCGVPQGSILGPLFFITYINDAQSAVNNSRIQFYADDTVIYVESDNYVRAAHDLQQDLGTFFSWCKSNILTINKKKTKLMTFGTRSKVKKSSNAIVKIDGEKLQLVPSFKYLGVVLDSALTFSNHIKTVLDTVAHKSYLLGKIRKYITSDTALLIYKSMVLPYFDYADIIYANSYKKDLDKVQRMQNRCLKICLRAEARIDTDLLHSMSKIPKLSLRWRTHVNNFMYQRQSKVNLLDIKPVNTRARDATMFKVLTPKLEAYKRSLAYHGSVQWNALPSAERNVDGLLTFKTIQKKWLESTF